MPADMSVKDMFQMIAAKIDGFEDKLNCKFEGLATKEDLQKYSEDVKHLQKSNEVISATLEELKSDRDEYKRKFEQMERLMRSKNIIIKRYKYTGNVWEAVKQLLNNRMQIQAEIDEVKVIGQTAGKAGIIMVKFRRDESVSKVFGAIRKLTGTGVIIERDFSEATRKKIEALLKVKKYIKTMLMEKKDKEKAIKVIGDNMMIEQHRFQWHDGKLWCGTEMGYLKLNEIFKCKFDELSFNFTDIQQ